jgi:hypothetical protein
MVKKKSKEMSLVLYHHEFNNDELLTEIIRQALGYEYTQAINCAHIIINKGNYIVKTFKVSEMNKAKATEALFIEQGIPAKLLLKDNVA